MSTRTVTNRITVELEPRSELFESPYSRREDVSVQSWIYIEQHVSVLADIVGNIVLEPRRTLVPCFHEVLSDVQEIMSFAVEADTTLCLTCRIPSFGTGRTTKSLHDKDQS